MSSTGTDNPGVVEIEDQVARIWKEVLDIPEVVADMTFHELGGQSIAAVRIVARIRDDLNVRVDLGELFENPRFGDFAAGIVTKADSPAQE